MKDKTMGFFAKIILTLLNYGFTMVLFFILVSTVFFNRSDMNFSTPFMLLATIAGLLIVTGLLFFVENFVFGNNWCRSKVKAKSDIVVALSFLLLFLFQLTVILSSATNINWDVGVLFDTATSANFRPIFESYFSYFPNNTLLLFFYRFLYDLSYTLFSVEIDTFRNILCVFNILAVDLGFFFGYLILKKFVSLRMAFRYLVMIVLLFGLSPWLMVPYSDTLSIPFTTGSLYLLLKIKEGKTIHTKLILSVVTGFVFMLGYSIKPSVIIVLIAATIIYCVKNIVDLKKMLSFFLCFSVILITFFSTLKGWNHYLYAYQTQLPMEEEVRFPWTYWLATGISKPYGVCNEEDQWATIYRGTTERMTELHKELIKSRLTEMQITGYVGFLVQKFQWITSEGFFFWGEEGNLLLSADWDLEHSNPVKELFYYGGKFRPVFYFYSQSIWIFILFYSLLSGWIINKSKNIKLSTSGAIIQCILTGIFMFILLFEGRSRYLILFLPYFAMLAAVGFEILPKTNKNIKQPGGIYETDVK